MVRLALYIVAAYVIAMAAVAVLAIPSVVMSWIRTTNWHSESGTPFVPVERCPHGLDKMAYCYECEFSRVKALSEQHR